MGVCVLLWILCYFLTFSVITLKYENESNKIMFGLVIKILIMRRKCEKIRNDKLKAVIKKSDQRTFV